MDGNNDVKITLTKKQWSSCDTYVTGYTRFTFERVGKDRIEKAGEWSKHNIALAFLYNTNMPDDELIELVIPRDHLRILVCAVGRVAYEIDYKGITNGIAQKVIAKIEEQLKDDEYFQRFRD
jgi:hypothetical protein